MKPSMNPESKHQLIDDDSLFRIQELQRLMAKDVKCLDKSYHIVSVIGSQSSGKSALLNSLFGTDFEVLNRKKRVGQTTKGIWYSIDMPSKTMILDVEGSDSSQRQQRTKIQRRNSLFALAVSHTLLINMWIQQIGLYKGSQMAILQIILELNLKLFGQENPKQIIFVVRDFDQNRQNQQALREKLFSKVQETWKEMPKPPNKTHVQLSDLFSLNAFFMPSKLLQSEQFGQSCTKLRKSLVDNAPTRGIYNNNVAMKDFPVYLKNLWETIENDKDINLPQQKILLSNMKCQQIKKAVYEAHQQEFRDQLQRSQRQLNLQFAANITKIIDKMMSEYSKDTAGYIHDEVEKVKQQFILELERKVQISLSYQVKHIVEDRIKEFNDNVNTLFLRDKNIESIKALKPEVVKKFKDQMDKVCLRSEWAKKEVEKFSEEIDKSFNVQKQKIVIQSLKQFDRCLKKQVDNLVSNAFCDKSIFCEKFWKHISTVFNSIEHQVKNSIIGLYKKLQFSDTKGSRNDKAFEYIEKAKHNAHEQLCTAIKMKCHDLLYYMMRHFKVDFNMDQKQIPHQWQKFTPEQIKDLFERVKDKYLDLISQFSCYQFETKDEDEGKTQKQMNRYTSTLFDRQQQQKQLLTSAELMTLNTKLKEQMKLQYQEALKKNKQVYMGKIPKWAWILFLVVAIDDVVLWFKSPYLLIPIVIIMLTTIVIFLAGGKGLILSLVDNAKTQGMGLFRNVATQAAGAMLKKS